MPPINPTVEMFDTLFSISPVVNMHPAMTKIIDNTFDLVIFSLKMMYAIIITKTGAELKSTAAIDNEIVFMAVL